MGWRNVTIAGKPCAVFDPGKRTDRGVLFLHNARGQPLSASDTYTQWLDHLGLTCVCPWGGQAWWTDRVMPSYDPAGSAESYVLSDVVPFMDRELALSVPSIGLLGISMGGQGALRLAFKHPDIFPVVAAVAPAIDYHEYYGLGTPLDQLYTSKEQCRQDTAGMHVRPGEAPPHIFFCCDPADEHWQRGCDRLHEKLNALGVAHEADLETSAGGHSWTYFDAMAERALSFLARGLAQVARKLI